MECGGTVTAHDEQEIGPIVIPQLRVVGCSTVVMDLGTGASFTYCEA